MEFNSTRTFLSLQIAYAIGLFGTSFSRRTHSILASFEYRLEYLPFDEYSYSTRSIAHVAAQFLPYLHEPH